MARHGFSRRERSSGTSISSNEWRIALLAGAFLGLVWNAGTGEALRAAAPERVSYAQLPQRAFGICHTGGGTNCVVDGDTFWIDGEKVRISDIDTPETHPPRCPEEARLGAAATLRLRALLNAGPVTLSVAGSDTDRYGRKLRVVERNGRSLGAQLVAEGLARPWTGRRQPWCGTA